MNVFIFWAGSRDLQSLITWPTGFHSRLKRDPPLPPPERPDRRSPRPAAVDSGCWRSAGAAGCRRRRGPGCHGHPWGAAAERPPSVQSEASGHKEANVQDKEIHDALRGTETSPPQKSWVQSRVWRRASPGQAGMGAEVGVRKSCTLRESAFQEC